uniref:Uncharacterized protein n=1 Tax=Glossina pallidipes TaxID=7398 RepID=A0A1B0A819_GLOPL
MEVRNANEVLAQKEKSFGKTTFRNAKGLRVAYEVNVRFSKEECLFSITRPMPWSWRKICNTISGLLGCQKPERSVTFNESTLLREFQQRFHSEPSINPFLNFLAQVRGLCLCNWHAPRYEDKQQD